MNWDLRINRLLHFVFSAGFVIVLRLLASHISQDPAEAGLEQGQYNCACYQTLMARYGIPNLAIDSCHYYTERHLFEWRDQLVGNIGPPLPEIETLLKTQWKYQKAFCPELYQYDLQDSVYIWEYHQMLGISAENPLRAAETLADIGCECLTILRGYNLPDSVLADSAWNILGEWYKWGNAEIEPRFPVPNAVWEKLFKRYPRFEIGTLYLHRMMIADSQAAPVLAKYRAFVTRFNAHAQRHCPQLLNGKHRVWFTECNGSWIYTRQIRRNPFHPDCLPFREYRP